MLSVYNNDIGEKQMLIIVKTLILSYIVFIISVVMHELFHYVTCKIFKINDVKVYIGENKLQKAIGDIYISPIITSGTTEINIDDIINLKKTQIAIIFLSGNLANFVFLIISILLNCGLISNLFILVNLFLLFSNLIPYIIRTNDMSMMLKILKLKKERSE